MNMNTSTNTPVQKMGKGFIGWIVVIGIVLIIGSWLVGTYNGFVSKGIAVDTQWSQVENQFQRRFDLIDNLVNTVKGATKQESEVFKAIADARTRYAGAATTDQKVGAANEYQSALGRLLVITENYPQLKSIDSFNNLMVEITGTENRVSMERGRFNEKVGEYNVSVKRFPGALMASIFGFKERALFKAAEGSNIAPKVQF